MRRHHQLIPVLVALVALTATGCTDNDPDDAAATTTTEYVPTPEEVPGPKGPSRDVADEDLPMCEALWEGQANNPTEGTIVEQVRHLNATFTKIAATTVHPTIKTKAQDLARHTAELLTTIEPLPEPEALAQAGTALGDEASGTTVMDEVALLIFEKCPHPPAAPNPDPDPDPDPADTKDPSTNG